MIGELIAATIGTMAFALLFGVPKKYSIFCGLIGCAGWLLYRVLMNIGLTATEATFFATVLIVLLSRFTAVLKECPATVFLVSGIFPLVPGAGIYWASYYLVTNQLSDAVDSGFAAIKAAVAIVLGIVLVFELPYKFFNIKKK